MRTFHWVSMNLNLYKTMIIMLTIHWVVLQTRIIMSMHEFEFVQTRMIMLSVHWVSMNLNLYKRR